MGMAYVITVFVPKEFYNPNNSFFRERLYEQRLYRKIRISRWKDRLPQYNVNFNKKYLPEKLTSDFIEQFIMETCRAELVHIAICIFSFSSIILVYLQIEPLYVFVIVEIIIFVAQIPFILIQRYNRPRLIKYLKRLK